jgi:hypothetical protein
MGIGASNTEERRTQYLTGHGDARRRMVLWARQHYLNDGHPGTRIVKDARRWGHAMLPC